MHQPSRPDVDIPVDREAAQWVGHELHVRRAPAIGEHNEEIVCGLLGRSGEDYVSLVLAEVLG